MHIFINRDLEIRLSEDSSQYKQFWKQICKFGEYVNPNGNGKMILDKKFADEMVGNFKSGKYGVVSVPLGHPKDSIELAELNRGEVKDLKITDDGIDALIEIRDDDTADKIEKRLIPDASMGFSEDYLDKRTGKYVGAFLKHVGLVADPYIKGMNQFVALSESSASILFSDKEIKKGEEMNLVKIKNDRDFDIEVQFTLNDEERNELIKAGEVEESPEDLNAKSVHICNDCGDHHCLKAETKTKNEKQKDKDQNALETIFRDMTNEQIERAIESDFEDFNLGDKDREKFKQRIKVILLSVLVTRGVVAWSDFVSILKQNNISTDDLTEFKLSDKLKKHYNKMIADFTKSFSEDTARSIANRVAQAEIEDWNKEQLARSLRDITKTEEWRIQRIARTETHRAHGLAGVEAGVQIQNESGVQIYKEWVVVSHNPCKYCRGMDGRRVNVTESYVKKGGILIGKSKIRVNDYADIDTAGAHPNCSCVEKFGIEEERDKIFDYSKLNQNDPEYMYPHEQDFYERLVKNFNNVERVPKHKTEPSNDFTINGEAWELKSILGKVKPMTIRNEIYHATDKGKRNIFLDVYNQDIDVSDVIEKAKKHISIKKNNDKIDSLIVVSGDKFHKIK